MKTYPYLFCRNATFYFRRVVPLDIRPIVQQREVIRSLATRDIKIARKMAIEMADKFDELFDEIRRSAKLLENRDLAPLIQDVRQSSVKPVVDRVLTTDSLAIPQGKAYAQLCRSVLKVLADSHVDAELIIKGDFENPRMIPIAARSTSSCLPPLNKDPDGLSFDVAISKYLGDQQASWDSKQLTSQTAKFNYFLRYANELDGLNATQRTLAAVTSAQVRAYKEYLQSAPSNASKKYPSLTPSASVAAAQLDQAKLFSQTTINNYLQCMSTLYGFAINELDYEGKNPFMGRGNSKVAKKTQREQRHPFSRDQLSRLFTSPLFIGCKSLSSCHLEGKIVPVQSHKYWVPLIGLFTGMRLQEILQLYVEDVYSQDGIWVFDLNLNHEDQRLKSPHSRRLVPLHPYLIKLGILEHLKIRKATGKSQRLFPDAKIASDGTYSSTFSKWFGRYLKNINIKTDKTSFHSLRHNVKDLFRQSGESDELAENFVGRSTGSTGEAYGSGFTAERLQEALNKLNYTPLLDVEEMIRARTATGSAREQSLQAQQ